MSFPALEVVQAPEGTLGALNRMVALLDRAEPAVRRRFIQEVGAARGIGTLEEIADLLEAGNVEGALRAADGVAEGMANSLESIYAAAGVSAAAVIRADTDTLFNFNALNARSVATLQRERLRLVREFTTDQREATRVLLEDAFERGLAPIEQARVMRGSIGLTQRQAGAVRNFRRMLESGNASALNEALTRQLRDRRFDPSIRAAAEGRRVLQPAQIDRMVDRYRDRYIQYRANTIARTETVAAVHAGDEEAWAQAIESGIVTPDAITQVWNARDDGKTRPSHDFMDGQEQPFGQPFESGLGNRLRFPGDPLAPPEDTVNCRCVVARGLNRAERVRIPLDQRIAAG